MMEGDVMARSWKKWLVGFIAGMVMLVPTVAHAQPSISQQRHAIHEYLVQHNINGIVLVNGHHQQAMVIANRTDRKNAQRVTPNKLFPIASLQKLVTGLAVMSLVNHHQVTLRTPLSDYYSGISYANQITIFQLMTHHSGLRDLNNQPDKALKSERTRLKFGLSALQSTGDFSWKYADADFIMLAAIIRHASHHSYHYYVMHHVMQPAHIKRFQPAAATNAKAIPLNKGKSWTALTNQMSANFGAGDYLMTPKDYWRLVMTDVMKNHRFVYQLLRVQSTPGHEAYFGGVYVNDPIIHANGNYGPYNCCVWANVRTKQMVMFFTNNISYHQLRQTGSDLFNIYFGYPYVKGTNRP